VGQIYLFTGQNAFALREERKAWRDRFAEKHGLHNLLEVDSSLVTWRTLLDEVGTAPFAAEKRLVMVMGIPRLEKEQVEMLPLEIHSSCILAFWEPKLDKRLGGTKALLALATVKECTPLTGNALRKWMEGYALAQGSVLQSAAADLLLSNVGEVQDTLSQ